MTVKKWGNSLATRIPKSVADSVNLHLDQDVDIEVVNGKIIITPLSGKKEYALADLLAQCNAGGVSLDEEDREWLNAEPAGKEIW